MDYPDCGTGNVGDWTVGGLLPASIDTGAGKHNNNDSTRCCNATCHYSDSRSPFGDCAICRATKPDGFIDSQGAPLHRQPECACDNYRICRFSVSVLWAVFRSNETPD